LIAANRVCAFAQPESKNYPVQFSQFIFSYPLINPASLGVHASNEVLLGYQKPVSGFAGVSTYFCNISFVPYRLKSASKNKSIVGLRFYNDNEGAYINRMRFYGMYAFHTPINSRLNFSGGIDFGGMNFSVKSTPTTEGASTFNVDANAGVWLYNNNFHVGVSLNQLFNSILKPLEEKTKLPTHMNLSASKTILSNENVVIGPHVLVTFPYYDRISIRASLYGLFFNRFITVVGWNRKTNLSYMLGVSKIRVLGNEMQFILSYNTSLSRASVSINQWEISFAYSL
jgi:type IX secretion system PorP/SprF family membrane protein